MKKKRNIRGKGHENHNRILSEELHHASSYDRKIEALRNFKPFVLAKNHPILSWIIACVIVLYLVLDTLLGLVNMSKSIASYFGSGPVESVYRKAVEEGIISDKRLMEMYPLGFAKFVGLGDSLTVYGESRTEMAFQMDIDWSKVSIRPSRDRLGYATISVPEIRCQGLSIAGNVQDIPMIEGSRQPGLYAIGDLSFEIYVARWRPDTVLAIMGFIKIDPLQD